MNKIVQYFRPKQEMNYFESLKTDFLIVQSFIIAILLLILIAKTILFPDDNFIIIFTSRTLFLIFLLVVLFILKNKGLKIAGNIFGLGAMAIALIPMNIFVDDISVMYKYMYGFYIVFFILAYVLLFSNRIVLIINTVLILITTTRIYFYAASHSLEDVLFFQVGYANHSAVVILTSIVFYFIHRFTELTINKANQEMAIQKHQNEELLFAQEKLRKNELELEQHNEILDNKVNHRTEELQKLNNTLVAANVKLEQSEKEIKKLSQAINQSSASIIITDLEGKIEYSNPSFTEITGYTSDDAKNSNPRLLKSGFTTKEEYDKLWNTISEGKTWKGEFLNVKKNKETFWEKAIITPVLNKSNEIINYIAIKDDITEQKKIELEILNQKQELQKLNATKDKFFSIIAHDLRSPFSAIVGYLDILLKNSRTYDDQKREQMIKLITDSAKNTFNLLENLLTWARSQYDGIEFSPKKVNLKVLLVEIIDSLMAQANKKEIKFYNAIKDDEVVFADENMLSTILRNLISNSIKFTPRGGMITLWTGKQVNDKFVKIFVMDTGIGIPKNKIDDLFQIDRSTIAQGTENEMGTGLGLLLCKEFVEKHGGKIGVESEEGEGSKFIFTLPVTD